MAEEARVVARVVIDVLETGDIGLNATGLKQDEVEALLVRVQLRLGRRLIVDELRKAGAGIVIARDIPDNGLGGGPR